MARNWSDEADEFLAMVYWGIESLWFPSFAKIGESFEGWKYRTGWRKQVGRLEQAELLRTEGRAEQMVCRLTELGRLRALGGRDPEQRWQRVWDGQWRMVVFDLPVGRQGVRQRLLRWFRQNSFGYLQNSVWIHPDPVTDVVEALKEFRDDVESFTVMEAHCCAGYSNDAIVHGAWDLEMVNKRYANFISQASGELRRGLPSKKEGVAELRSRLRQQRQAWSRAVAIDPLLPRALLPPDYLGQRAWQSYRETMTRLVRAMRKD